MSHTIIGYLQTCFLSRKTRHHLAFFQLLAEMQVVFPVFLVKKECLPGREAHDCVNRYHGIAIRGKDPVKASGIRAEPEAFAIEPVVMDRIRKMFARDSGLVLD